MEAVADTGDAAMSDSIWAFMLTNDVTPTKFTIAARFRAHVVYNGKYETALPLLREMQIRLRLENEILVEVDLGPRRSTHRLNALNPHAVRLDAVGANEERVGLPLVVECVEHDADPVITLRPVTLQQIHEDLVRL